MTDTSSHPLLVMSPSKAHGLLFTKMRDKNTSSVDFVYYAKRAMRLVAEDALAEFPTTISSIETPCGPFEGLESVAPTDLCAVSIVRSGDVLLESVREILPACKVGKILIQRDESHPKKLPKLFYSKFPPGIKDMFVLLCDPMLATGGSAITALDVLVKGNGVDPKKIIFANMICAPQGLRVLAAAYPDVKIVTAVVDKELNDDKFIVPGLGDYGDRFFNTV
ncbi:Uracil phosphoribosyltransferase [Seminavis robusta]|uniref:uracil phosphoribosyltransferase n=1 Tax=Seminavis robusta TaxID=568900 RepID=A0A9N8D470_9STRA|nr:Uracil phosphoribosyltransferase [Seminavis robusta]|eukprot:Sro1_g000620.1 Uracil phosphoribosyltransferase (222) ;mRNA; r:179317-180088